MKNFLITLFFSLTLVGCAMVSKVNTGEIVVRDRMTVTVKDAWNQFEAGMADNAPTWTKEGVAVDALKFYVGIKNGDLIAPTPAGQNAKPLAFQSSMKAAEVSALYQALLTRDGSSFTLEKLEPTSFAGSPGFRFEYSLVRKQDDVRLRGIAVGAVRGGELFLIHYSAPRLAFFPKYAPQVETLIQSARIKG
ncbi:MAG: hypothetical protein ACKOF9_10020 [Burkholderiales bacterium]